MRIARRIAPLVLALMIGLAPGSVSAAPPTIAASVVQDGLTIPWDLAFTPNGRMFVTERSGTLRLYASGSVGAAQLMSWTIPNIRAEGEAGLLGIAVDVNFSTNHLLYLCASRQVSGAWRNQVLRYRLTSDLQLADLKVLIAKKMAAYHQHNGCAVEMSEDGRLWISMGDAGAWWLAQDPNSYNGKILRITRNGGIPADNPILPGASGRSAVYSMGHRNPQGIAFRPSDGAVFASEHGPELDDEINPIEPGGNYGWPCYTGDGDPYQDNGSCGPAGDYLSPAWASGFPTVATSGAAFRGGAAWGDWAGQLFVATLKENDLRRFSVSGNGQTATQLGILYNGQWGRLRAVVTGPNGTLYLTTSNGSDDKVIRLRPT